MANASTGLNVDVQINVIGRVNDDVGSHNTLTSTVNMDIDIGVHIYHGTSLYFLRRIGPNSATNPTLRVDRTRRRRGIHRLAPRLLRIPSPALECLTLSAIKLSNLNPASTKSVVNLAYENSGGVQEGGWEGVELAPVSNTLITSPSPNYLLLGRGAAFQPGVGLSAYAGSAEEVIPRPPPLLPKPAE